LITKILPGVLETSQAKQREAPEIAVTGQPFVAPHANVGVLRPGVSMAEVEQHFEALARKSSNHIDSVHEVDMAFLTEARGITDYRAGVVQGQVGLTAGGDARGEKVFAVGHRQALGFQGALSNKGGERFYAVLFPLGFIKRYGADLRTAGSEGKSAKTPNDQEFSAGEMMDNNKKVELGRDKAFAVRAEDATPQGQVHMHFARNNMKIDGKKMTHIEFFRRFAIGVVEFDTNGIVRHFRLF
jgi:hypothetical protein